MKINYETKLNPGDIVYIKNDFDFINGNWKLKQGKVKRSYVCKNLALLLPYKKKIVERWDLESEDFKLINQSVDNLLKYSEIGE